MDPGEAIRIFLSYARKDGVELARRLYDDLTARGFEAWLDQHRIAAGASWTDEIEQALDRAAFFLALLTRGSYESEICRAEQLRALRKGKLVIPLLGQSDPDVVPLYLEGKHYRDLAADYAGAFAELMDDIAHRRSLAALPARYRDMSYETVPALPPNYVERASELRALRDALVTDGEGRHIALTALRGMGGIGKTILARALCHDPVVKEAFPDGIVWLTIGRESTAGTLARLREAGKALGDDLSRYENEAAAQNRFRSILQKQAALIVLDDVWDGGAIEPFLADSPRSRLLITTRDASIAAGAGATEHIADLLSEADARSVLARWSGVAVERQPPEAATLIRESGRLPLAVAMIGAMLRGKPERYWARVVTLLREAELKKIRAQFPDYPHHDLFRAMEVGVAALDETTRARYLRLAVTLEDMAIAPAVQRTLWGTEEGETLDTAEALIGLSLAQRVGDDSAIRLHDLQLDYLRARWPDRDALRLIHGAVRLSMHVLEMDPAQFASQTLGRLLGLRDTPGITTFVDEVAADSPRPWIRPLHACLDAPGGPLLRTLKGHSFWANGVAVTPDGTLAVSASSDRTLKVWNLETGRELRTLEGHSDSVCGAAVTPDGKLAVSASADRTLKVWDLETGRELRTLEGHLGWVNGVAMTLDGKRAVSASGDKTLKVWNLETGACMQTLEGHSSPVLGVALTPDGKRAVSASRDQALKVWDVDAGRVLRTLEGHATWVSGAAVTQDGRWAVSASWDKTLKVWDLETGCAVRTLVGHSGTVNGVAMSADGKRAISASQDKTLRTWDLGTGRALQPLEGHSGPVLGVAVTADGKRAVSASADSTLKVWDLGSDPSLRSLEGHPSRVLGVAITPDGKRVVSAFSGGALRVWDPIAHRALHTLEGHCEEARGVAITPDGKRVVSASVQDGLMVWDLDTGRMLEGYLAPMLPLPPMHPLSVKVRSFAVRTFEDNTLKTPHLASWSAKIGGTPLSTPEGCSEPAKIVEPPLSKPEGYSRIANAVATTPDGKWAVFASNSKTLSVRDFRAGYTVRILEGHSSFVTGVTTTPDGKWAVSASWDRTLKVWDLNTGRVLNTLVGHSDGVTGVAVTPDGKRAVSASFDRTLKVWDLETGRELRTLEGHSDSVYNAAVTPDGKRAISASGDGTIRVWDLGAGQTIAAFHCDAPVRCCACGPSNLIGAGDDAGRVYFLALEEWLFLPAPPPPLAI
jgi:WD40 repeat protein